MTDTYDTTMLMCPFCGKCVDLHFYLNEGYWIIECQACDVRMKGTVMDSLIRRWNTRMISNWEQALKANESTEADIILYDRKKG